MNMQCDESRCDTMKGLCCCGDGHFVLYYEQLHKYLQRARYMLIFYWLPELRGPLLKKVHSSKRNLVVADLNNDISGLGSAVFFL